MDVIIRKGRRFQHRYFKAKSGCVLDYWWGRRRGMVFENEEVYEKTLTIDAPWWLRML